MLIALKIAPNSFFVVSPSAGPWNSIIMHSHWRSKSSSSYTILRCWPRNCIWLLQVHNTPSTCSPENFTKWYKYNNLHISSGRFQLSLVRSFALLFYKKSFLFYFLSCSFLQLNQLTILNNAQKKTQTDRCKKELNWPPLFSLSALSQVCLMTQNNLTSSNIFITFNRNKTKNWETKNNEKTKNCFFLNRTSRYNFNQFQIGITQEFMSIFCVQRIQNVDKKRKKLNLHKRRWKTWMCVLLLLLLFWLFYCDSNDQAN